MAYVIPDHHKRELRAALELAGWDIELADAPAEAWWMHEVWRVPFKKLGPLALKHLSRLLAVLNPEFSAIQKFGRRSGPG